MSRSQRSSSGGLAPLLLLGAAVGVTCGVAGYLVQSSRSEPEPSRAEDPGYFAASGGGFDLGHAAAGAAAAPRASSVSPMPFYGQGAAPTGAPQAAAAAPRPPVAATMAMLTGGASPRPLAESASRSDSRFTALLESPAQYVARKTLLGSGAGLKGFLKDPARWKGYLRHPLVAGVLGSPTLVKLLLRPAVVHAFVASPAMNDSSAVKALAESPMTRDIIASPGVAAALGDPGVLTGIIGDPQLSSWLSTHPEGRALLMQAGSGLAAHAPL